MAKQRINDFFMKDDGVWDGIMFGFIDRVDKNGTSWLTNSYYKVEDMGRGLYCRIKGHDFQPDQCGIPEHDYCIWCLAAPPDDELRIA
jgi:hypothetical protein